uniref:Activin_recp domain-containing protein n=1 Tax=Syphacia muris TaxID=451379 RepID=A0A0N5APC0_9BILA
MLIYFLTVFLFGQATAIQCYTGSAMQIFECPSLNCIKQTIAIDRVRYCDGTGQSSICQTYRIFESCQAIPNLGYICCCSDPLCNSAKPILQIKYTTCLITLLYLILQR